MSFSNPSTLVLTIDTDSGRLNSNTAVVIDPTGKRVVFYEKQLASGLTSYSPVNSFLSITLPFTINVPAGTGTINATPVSWSATTKTATANTFQLLYVSNTGVVTITDTWDMNITKNAIILAFVYNGATEITILDRCEKLGSYIFIRVQTAPGVWGDDKEYILNVGEQPKAFIDSSNKIYLSYIKDSAAFVRVIDFSQPSTLVYLQHTIVSNNMTQISLTNDPANLVDASLSSGYEGSIVRQDTKLYMFSSSNGFAYQKVLGVYQPFVYLPYLTGDYLQCIIFPYYVQFFSYMTPNYVLVDSIPVYDLKTDLKSLTRWFQWTHGNGTFYVGAKVYNTLTNEPYITAPADYFTLTIFDPFTLLTFPDATHISDEIIEAPTSTKISSGYEGTVQVTYQYESTKDSESDSENSKISSGYEGVVQITSQFDNNKDLENDSISTRLSCGHTGVITIL